MVNRFSSKLLTGLFLFAAACSGGSSNETGDVSIRCGNGDAFCLISCDLGCSQTGCSVTEIAENQRLRFVFSSPIARSSLNGSSISIRTPSGATADGSFAELQNLPANVMVLGRELTFVPRLNSVGGSSTFGFQRNETYVITLPAASAGAGLRSVSGHGLTKEFSCTVVASRGIQDEDQQAPTVKLLRPTTLTNVTDPTIQLQFSELIDAAPLQGVLSASSPVNFIVRTTVDAGGTRVCNNDLEGTPIQSIPIIDEVTVGDRAVTVLTLVPPAIPGLRCITVNVTGDLRDLSGRPAVPATFEIITAASSVVPITVTEPFTDNSRQDVDVSSGIWSNGARAGLIGGDGRHGSFKLAPPMVVNTPNTNEWVMDSASTLIPASSTFSGVATTVTNGKYFFTDFVLPANTVLKFRPSDATTSRPVPQIFVRGKVEILGDIDISGGDLPFWTPPATHPASGEPRVSDFNARSVQPAPGQAGTFGGVGGGKGGNGGNEPAQPLSPGPTGTTNDPETPLGSGFFPNRGQPGQDARLIAGHAFNAATTGGRGARMGPLSGYAPVYAAVQLLTVPVQLPAPGGIQNQTFRVQFSPGGGGGGFALPGGVAAVTTSPAVPPVVIATAQPGGVALGDLSLPANLASLDYYTIGGSGGGGGGAHAYGTTTFPATGNLDYFIAGSAGTGGGGTMAIRSGGNLTIGPNADLKSRGGRGVLITGDNKDTTPSDITWGISSPGGGGSGGSFLLQAAGNLAFNGAVDTSGGDGSRTGKVYINTTTLSGINIVGHAGAGSSGFYRLEAGGAVNFAGTGVPAFIDGVNSATLTDRDDITISMSKWRQVTQLFAPLWIRYELDVDVDGDGVVDITYTDSGVPGTQKANAPTDPVNILFQGAVLNQAGTAPEFGESPEEWRDGVGSGAGPGITLDSPTGFRFLLRFNRTLAPNCVVRALRVFAEA